MEPHNCEAVALEPTTGCEISVSSSRSGAANPFRTLPIAQVDEQGDQAKSGNNAACSGKKCRRAPGDFFAVAVAALCHAQLCLLPSST